MTHRLLFLGLFAGCEPGANSETLLEELRLVAAIAEPPEVAPGEPYSLTAIIADPLGEGAEVALWSCLPESDCIEETTDLSEDWSVSTQAIGVAPLPLWIAACAPGVCDLDSRTDDDRQDPSMWLNQQPLVGVTAGFRLTRITDAPIEERASNPVVDTAPAAEDLLDVPAGELQTLSFVVPGATEAFGLATSGGFARPSREIASDGTVALEWFPADSSGAGEVFVVFIDDSGGTAVWRADTSAL